MSLCILFDENSIIMGMMKKKVLAAVILCLSLMGIVPAKAADSDIVISASIAILVDTETGAIIYEKDSSTSVAMTGIANLMTLLVSLDCDAEEVTYTSNGASFRNAFGYTDGETLSLEDLRYAVLVGNYDDAAYALSSAMSDSTTLLNEKASELGMTNTVFTNSYGQADSAQVTTAADIAVLARQFALDSTLKTIYAANSYTPTTFSDNTPFTKTPINYDGLIGNFDTASDETGTVSIASVEKDGMSLTAVVMQASSADTAHSDITELFDYAFDNYKNVVITAESVGTKTVEIQDGDSVAEVTFTLGTDLNALMASSVDESGITTDIEVLDEDSVDDVRAYAVIYLDGSEIGRFTMTKTIESSSSGEIDLIYILDMMCAAVAGGFILLFVIKYASTMLRPKE